MDNELNIKMYSITLGCKDPLELAKFYESLLHWTICSIEEEWVLVYNPETSYGALPGILFQKNTEYVTPVWPQKTESQQQMAHIDFTVNDLEKAVQHAVNCGAIIAKEQYFDECKVMIDPAGHLFYLCL